MTYVENHLCAAEKCFLHVQLSGKVIEPESCVSCSGDSKGGEKDSCFARQARKASGKCRVCRTVTSIVARSIEPSVSLTCNRS